MATTQQKPITPERMLDLATLNDIQLSPDGAIAVFVLGHAFTETGKPASASVVAATLDNGAIRSYSPHGAHDRMPRWSPDGGRLAILSDRRHDGADDASAAPTWVYALSRDGTDAHPLGVARGDVHDMVWVPDGSRLILLMTESQPENDGQSPPRDGASDVVEDVVEVEKHPRFARLWSLDMGGGDMVALTPAGAQVWEFGLAPDGREAAVVVSDAPFEWSWYQTRLAMVSLSTGSMTTSSSSE